MIVPVYEFDATAQQWTFGVPAGLTLRHAIYRVADLDAWFVDPDNVVLESVMPGRVWVRVRQRRGNLMGLGYWNLKSRTYHRVVLTEVPDDQLIFAHDAKTVWYSIGKEPVGWF